MMFSCRSVTRKTAYVSALSAFFALAPSAARADCTKDTDCKGDRVCESGKCVSPSVPPGATQSGAPATGSSAPADSPTTSTPAPAPPSEAPDSSPASSGIRYEPGPSAEVRPKPVPPVAATPAAAAPATAQEPKALAGEPGRPMVELWITSEGSAANFVSFRGMDDAHVESCQAPCTLRVRPGRGTLYVRGSQTYEQEIVVPAHGTNVTLKTASSPWYFVLGGAAFAAGAFSAYLAVRSFDDVPECAPYTGFDATRCNDDRTMFTVYGVLFTGGAVAMAVAGIASLANGASRGGSRAVLPDEAVALRPVRFAGAGVTPLHGGGAGTLRFTF